MFKTKKIMSIICIALIFGLFFHTVALASAGLYTRIYSPNNQYKIEIMNLHYGWAGPWPETQNIKHTNIHIWKWTGTQWIEKANYHVSSSTNQQQGKICYYIYESKSGYSYKNCHSNYNKSAAQNEMQQKLKNHMNQITNYQMVATVATAAAIIIIVWVTWPLVAIGLAAV